MAGWVKSVPTSPPVSRYQGQKKVTQTTRHNTYNRRRRQRHISPDRYNLGDWPTRQDGTLKLALAFFRPVQQAATRGATADGPPSYTGSLPRGLQNQSEAVCLAQTARALFLRRRRRLQGRSTLASKEPRTMTSFAGPVSYAVLARADKANGVQLSPRKGTRCRNTRCCNPPSRLITAESRRVPGNADDMCCQK